MAEPLRVFDTLTAFQQSGALHAAIDLDLFTILGEGPAGVADLARRTRASERGIRMLCDYLVTLDFLTKDGDRYDLTDDSRFFLDRRSPACMASAAVFLHSRFMIEGFADVTAAVRRGGTVAADDGALAPDHPLWVEFARGMAPIATATAELLAALLAADTAPPWKVLDIAAGHGMFGITLARHNPGAHVVAVDWANVLAVAEENAGQAGVADRFRGIAGSALDVDPGSGYDLVLLPNILHHFDTAGCEVLFRKARAALAPGGRAVTVEFVPDASRVSPPHAARFALIMLVGTPGGDAYTFAEYEAMAHRAGFGRSELHELPPSPQRVMVSYV